MTGVQTCALPICDTLALCPPLVINEDEIAELLKRLERALDETAMTLSDR